VTVSAWIWHLNNPLWGRTTEEVLGEDKFIFLYLTLYDRLQTWYIESYSVNITIHPAGWFCARTFWPFFIIPVSRNMCFINFFQWNCKVRCQVCHTSVVNSSSNDSFDVRKKAWIGCIAFKADCISLQNQKPRNFGRLSDLQMHTNATRFLSHRTKSSCSEAAKIPKCWFSQRQLPNWGVRFAILAILAMRDTLWNDVECFQASSIPLCIWTLMVPREAYPSAEIRG